MLYIGLYSAFLALINVQSIVCTGVNEIAPVMGRNDDCVQFCLKTFQNKNIEAKSCEQGCRLYSILELVRKTRVDGFTTAINATEVTDSCKNECNKAYNYSVDSLRAACRDGCTKQIPFVDGQLEIDIDDKSPIFPFVSGLISKNFGNLDNMRNNMMNEFNKFRNWFKNDRLPSFSDVKFDGDNSLDSAKFFDISESRLQNYFDQLDTNTKQLASKQLIQGERIDTGASDGSSTVNPLFAYAKNLEKMNNRRTPSSSGKTSIVNEDDDSDEIQLSPPVIMITKEVNGIEYDLDENYFIPNRLDSSGSDNVWLSLTQQRSNEPSRPPLSPNDVAYVDANDTWLACLARRTQSLSTVTQTFLCMSMMISILCIIYLCLAVVRANKQRRHHLPSQRDLENGNTKYWMAPPIYEKVEIPKTVDAKRQGAETPPPSYENLTK